MEKKKKNNAIPLDFTLCGTMPGTADRFGAACLLGSACGVVPYLAVTQIIIRILGKNYDLVPMDCWRSLRCWAISAEPG